MEINLYGKFSKKLMYCFMQAHLERGKPISSMQMAKYSAAIQHSVSKDVYDRFAKCQKHRSPIKQVRMSLP